MKPKFSISVVCPTYHSESFIRRAIDCLVEQTVAPAEVVFSDDGSTDRTVTILLAEAQRLEANGIRVTVLRNPHRGPGATRNRAIEAASEKWIAFLDSDDVWTTNKIERVRSEVEKSPRANFIVHWESYRRMDGSEAILENGSNYDPTRGLPQQLYRNNTFSTSATVVKSELLAARGQFDETFPSSQDYELWLRLSPEIRLAVIPEVLGYYYERAESITARPYSARYRQLMRILVAHRDKGGLLAFGLRTLRATFSRQWIGLLLRPWRGAAH